MKYRFALAGMTVAVLTACGGGGGASTDDATGTTPGTVTGTGTGITATDTTVSTTLSISGVAATGAALANASVAVTNSAGGSVCTESSVTTSALGAYSCTLKTGEVAPFFVVVTDPTGANAPLVSVSTTTPTAGTPLNINATPLTTAIVGQLSADGNALTLVRSGSVNAADLNTVTNNVVAQLAPVLESVNLSAYNPFTTRITAATSSSAGNTADLVLDVVKVVTDPVTGRAALSTIEHPTPVALASATTTAAEMTRNTVAAPSAGVSDLSKAQQLSVAAIEGCFALPTAQRVLSKDVNIPASSGGPAVTQVAPECSNIVSDPSNGGGLLFMNNGYQGGQFFYSMLIDDAMTGAKFSAPEILAFYPANAADPAGTTDRAIFNFRYVDNLGNIGNVTVMGRNIVGSSTASRPSNWWLTGNQQTVDVGVRHEIRRVQQMNVNSTSKSRFQSGLHFNINTMGPGNVDSTGAALSHARVKGPGLPTNGLVYVAPSSTTPLQAAMDLTDASAQIPAQKRCGAPISSSSPATNCQTFWLASTSGVTGSTTDRALGANPANVSFAQPGDGSDISKAIKGAIYTVELYYGTKTTPSVTVTKMPVTELVQPQYGADLPWHTLGARSLAALDPTDATLNGTQASLTIDWVNNAAAQTIAALAATGDATGSFGLSRPASRIATSSTSANYTVPGGGSIPALTSTSKRALLFHYQMNDGTRKTAVFSFN